MALILAAQTSLAAALDTRDRASALKRQMSRAVFSIQGVNSIGVGGCNPLTGLEDINGNFVHCVAIGTDSEAAYNRVLALYPRGTKIQGVFVVVRYMGVITAQPRLSVGN